MTRGPRFSPGTTVVWSHGVGNPRLRWKIVDNDHDYYIMEKLNGTNVGHRETMLVRYVDEAYEEASDA